MIFLLLIGVSFLCTFVNKSLDLFD
jgi:hypothetical protein